MAETNSTTEQASQGRAGVLSGYGKPVLVSNGSFVEPKKDASQVASHAATQAAAAAIEAGANQQGSDAAAAAAAAAAADAAAASAAAAAAGGSVAPKLSEDDLKAYFELNGMEWAGLDTLKSKLKKEPAATTEEDATKKAAQLDKRRLDAFVAKGGSIDQYTSIKKVAEMDLKELSHSETKRELIASGFTSDQAESIIKERYYQITEDDIDILDSDAAKELAKRKAEYFSEKLAKRGLPIQKDAQKIIANLDSEIEQERLIGEQEQQTVSMVDAYAAAAPRKITFNFGKVDNVDQEPFDFNVEEADISQVVEELKDPIKRKQILYNEDGSLNINQIAEALVYKRSAAAIAKAAASEGGSRQAKIFKATFGAHTAHAVGVGGGTGGDGATKTAGKLAGYGKPVVVKR